MIISEAVIVAVVTGMITVIVPRLLDRKWSKKDKTSDSQKAIMNGLEVLMIERIRSMARSCIDKGSITLTEKETMQEMYQSYKKLGGNGKLETILSAIEHLPISLDD